MTVRGAAVAALIDDELLDTGRMSARALAAARSMPADGPTDPVSEALRIAGLVNAAVADGRIPPRRRVTWARNLAAKPALEARLAALAPVPECHTRSTPRASATRRQGHHVPAAAGTPHGAAFARNPAVDATRTADPALAARAGSSAPTPTLFDAGDLPPFTASGIDPQALLQVPWQARHAVAAAPTPAAAYQLLQQYSGDEGAVLASLDLQGDPANRDYERQVDAWLAAARTDDEVYNSVGLDLADQQAADRLAERNAQARAAMPRRRP